MSVNQIWGTAVIGLGALVSVSVANAAVIGTDWVQVGPAEVWLYALVEPDTQVLNADLGDGNIDLPPGGVNTGLFSSNPAILSSSSPTIEPRSGSLFIARPLSFIPSGTGTRVDGAWFTDGSTTPALVDFGSGPTHAFLLLGVDLQSPTTQIGGPNGGPAGTTQSRIFVGWEDPDRAAGFGVFDVPLIPAPAAAILAVPLFLATRSRRRFLPIA